MTLEFVTTLLAICLISLSAFVLRSLPAWIWPLLVVSLVGLDGNSVERLRQPSDHREACTWACEDLYGKTVRYFITRAACIDRCCDR